jgi:hypothetical protein
MLNMVFQNRSARILCLLCYATILSLNAFSQQCSINATEFKPIYFSDLGMIEKLYQEKKSSEIDRIHIIYIDVFSGLNKMEAIYLGIDTNRKIEMIIIDQYSIGVSRKISNTDMYKLDFLFSDSSTTGYYESSCKNVVSSHRRSVLMIFDAVSERWIEYVSMDGNMKEALQDDTNYEYLEHCYKLVCQIFKDFEGKVLN